MNIVGVIPARFGSTRFEGKVLASLAGKPMIQHVWERAKQSRMLRDIIVATDDERVMGVCELFGAKAVMTSKEHESGTDRIAEVIRDMDVDVVLNIQGDEPLMHPSIIDDLAQAIVNDPECVMATVIKFFEKNEPIDDPNIVKVVVDEDQNALYFSRAVIPFNRDKNPEAVYCQHIGLYAYRKNFLLTFSQLPKSYLEKMEKLEQLRAVEAGYKIKTVLTKQMAIGVDTPEDLKKVEDMLS